METVNNRKPRVVVIFEYTWQHYCLYLHSL